MALTVTGLVFSYGDGSPSASRSRSLRLRSRGGGAARTNSSGDHSAAPLFNGFDAAFPRGGITAVAGPNGCGKTTLARLLVGILKPQSGEISIDGESTARLTLTEIGGKIGYVMQDPSRQIFKVSVMEEMTFGLHNIGLGADEAAEHSEEYLDLFGLSGRKDEFPFSLSVGERQRLVLAATLAMKPPYLILDEPTSSLDKGRKRALGGYLREIVGRDGTGVILISHDMTFVSSYADARVDIGPGAGGSKSPGAGAADAGSAGEGRNVSLRSETPNGVREGER